MRIGLSVTLSIMALSSVELSAALISVDKLDLFGALVSEALIGLMLGLGVSLLLAAGELMGDILAQLTGLNSSGADEADADSAPANTRLIGIVTLVMFVLARGPEQLIVGVLDSLQAIPIGSRLVRGDGLELLGELVTQSFWLALRGVGPAVAAMFAATTIVSLIQKVLPQSGVVHIGPTIGLVVMAVTMWITLSGGLWLIDGNWQAGWEKMLYFLKTDAVGATTQTGCWK
jgi:flagellar biosynthetic protein FliR